MNINQLLGFLFQQHDDLLDILHMPEMSTHSLDPKR